MRTRIQASGLLLEGVGRGRKRSHQFRAPVEGADRDRHRASLVAARASTARRHTSILRVTCLVRPTGDGEGRLGANWRRLPGAGPLRRRPRARAMPRRAGPPRQCGLSAGASTLDPASLGRGGPSRPGPQALQLNRREGDGQTSPGVPPAALRCPMVPPGAATLTQAAWKPAWIRRRRQLTAGRGDAVALVQQ
jgi:hypothetical protein